VPSAKREWLHGPWAAQRGSSRRPVLSRFPGSMPRLSQGRSAVRWRSSHTGRFCVLRCRRKLRATRQFLRLKRTWASRSALHRRWHPAQRHHVCPEAEACTPERFTAYPFTVLSKPAREQGATSTGPERTTVRGPLDLEQHSNRAGSQPATTAQLGVNGYFTAERTVGQSPEDPNRRPSQ
jgi:hypothetical protein